MESKKLYCPHHNVKLVLREAKHGTNRGTKFWGCPTWGKTACNYTEPYKSNKKIEPSIKEKILTKIKDKKGKISILKIGGQILLIPIYILGLGAAMTAKVFSSKRKMGL
jgi:hypothetical protein